MRRIKLFLKGNLDLYDSIHSCRVNDTLCWNGLNETLKKLDSELRVQIKHETFTRTDALLASSGGIPKALLRHHLELGSFPIETQFSQEIFNANVDAYILSIQPDISVGLVRHKTEGYLLNAAHFSGWNIEQVDWFRKNFSQVPTLSPVESMDNFRLIIDRLRKKSAAPILIFNVSSIIPGDNVHCHVGLVDSLSNRIQKFNLELINLSSETGISIIDVNRVLACYGIDRVKLDSWHLNATGLELVSKEVAKVLLEILNV